MTRHLSKLSTQLKKTLASDVKKAAQLDTFITNELRLNIQLVANQFILTWLPIVLLGKYLRGWNAVLHCIQIAVNLVLIDRRVRAWSRHRVRTRTICAAR